MNNARNQPFSLGQPYVPSRQQSVHIILDRKMFYQQRMVSLFGRERLAEINASKEPFILPLINYHNTFDVIIFILV